MEPTPSLPELKILLVDDHAVVRVGLRNLVEDEPGLKVVGEAGSCAEALRLAAAVDPDVVVLDLRLPDGSGVDIIGDLKRAVPRVRVLILTSFADDTLLMKALKAGADGYLLKEVAEGDLVGALREVARGGLVTCSMKESGEVPDASGAKGEPVVGMMRLTGQEKRVFELVGRGHSNREVATITGLTEKTVRNYLTRVFDKLGLRRRSEFVALYMSSGRWRG